VNTRGMPMIEVPPEDELFANEYHPSSYERCEHNFRRTICAPGNYVAPMTIFKCQIMYSTLQTGITTNFVDVSETGHMNTELLTTVLYLLTYLLACLLTHSLTHSMVQDII
jgi:hypothetical protein